MTADREEEFRDDRRLVAAMIAGDFEAFEWFSDRYIPAMVRFATSRLGSDRRLAKDIVQATICRVIEKLDTFRAEGSLLAWLLTSCRNEIAMHYRSAASRPREVSIDDDGVSPEVFAGSALERPDSQLLTAENATRVHVALDLLGGDYARVLVWKYIDDLAVREIADRLGVTEKAAESVLSRARRAFRELFDRLESAAGERGVSS